MYQISDQLLKHKEVIEAHLYSEERNLFGFEETITLYDLTNTYFEGSCKSNTLAAHGHSKEKRSDCPLVSSFHHNSFSALHERYTAKRMGYGFYSPFLFD